MSSTSKRDASAAAGSPDVVDDCDGMKAAFTLGQACVFVGQSLPAGWGSLRSMGVGRRRSTARGPAAPAPRGTFCRNQRAQLAATAPADEAVHPCRPPIAVEENDPSVLQRGQNLTIERVDVSGDMERLLGEHRHVSRHEPALLVVDPVDQFSEAAGLLAGEGELERIMAAVLELLREGGTEGGLAHAVGAFEHKQPAGQWSDCPSGVGSHGNAVGLEGRFAGTNDGVEEGAFACGLDSIFSTPTKQVTLTSDSPVCCATKCPSRAKPR